MSVVEAGVSADRGCLGTQEGLLFLLFSLLLCPLGHSLFVQKLGCHLLAEAYPGPRADAFTETSVVPAVIVVV